MTPPVRAGQMVAKQPSTWPMILGVISIVFGLGAAFMYGLCSPVMTLFIPMLGDSFRGTPGMEMSEAQMEAMEGMMPLLLGKSLVLGLLGAALLIAGIGMVRRRAWCMRWAVSWAIVKILVAIPDGFLSHHANKVQFEAMREGAASAGAQNAPPAAVFSLIDSLSVIGIIIGIAWAMALPVIMLFWFGRASVREEVASWRHNG